MEGKHRARSAGQEHGRALLWAAVRSRFAPGPARGARGGYDYEDVTMDVRTRTQKIITLDNASEIAQLAGLPDPDQWVFAGGDSSVIVTIERAE